MMTTAGFDSLLPLLFIALPVIMSGLAKRKKKQEAAAKSKVPPVASGHGGSQAPPAPPTGEVQGALDDLPDWVRTLASELGTDIPGSGPASSTEKTADAVIESRDVSPVGLETFAEIPQEFDPDAPVELVHVHPGPNLEQMRLEAQRLDKARGLSVAATVTRGSRRRRSASILIPRCGKGWRRAMVIREVLGTPRGDKPWRPVSLPES